MNLISKLQPAVGTIPQLMSCGGGNADVLKALYQDLGRQAGIQYPFCCEPIDIKKLMYESSYSVLGGIDVFFAANFIALYQWDLGRALVTVCYFSAIRVLSFCFATSW